jgi:hypothetical protein
VGFVWVYTAHFSLPAPYFGVALFQESNSFSIPFPPHFCNYSLKQLDIEMMRQLQHKVNVIPVIAKADSMTLEEVAEFKAKVRTPTDPYRCTTHTLFLLDFSQKQSERNRRVRVEKHQHR